MNHEQLTALIRKTLSRFHVNGRTFNDNAALHLASAIASDIVNELSDIADEATVEEVKP